MSDSVTVDQQRQEEPNALVLNSPVLEELIRTGQWIQDNRGELASPQTAGFWPNSNQTAVDVAPVRVGCSGTPKDYDSPASKDTDAISEGMTYVGGMNYANYRLEACRAKASGKQKMRPPALCVQDELTRENASSYRDGTVSTTSSRRSLAYRAVEEAVEDRNATGRSRSPTSLSTLGRHSCRMQRATQSYDCRIGSHAELSKCSLRSATRPLCKPRRWMPWDMK